MKKKIIVGLVIVGVLVLGYINLAVYPFQTQHPNFYDVERVFNKMRFPSDWQEIDSSENRGIAGRACPIESESRCYHMSKTFRTKNSVTIEKVKEVLLRIGCPAVTIIDDTTKDDKFKEYRLDCSIEGLDIGGDLDEAKREIYLSVAT